jgi:hypothetical protein
MRRQGSHIFSRQSAHGWRWGCQSYAPAALYPQEDSLYSFLLETVSRPQDHSAVGRIRSIENCNDLIGNLTHDVPAYSIVPQPTTIPHALRYKGNQKIIFFRSGIKHEILYSIGLIVSTPQFIVRVALRLLNFLFYALWSTTLLPATFNWSFPRACKTVGDICFDILFHLIIHTVIVSFGSVSPIHLDTDC